LFTQLAIRAPVDGSNGERQVSEQRPHENSNWNPAPVPSRWHKSRLLLLK
jgi:hypothetical protein